MSVLPTTTAYGGYGTYGGTPTYGTTSYGGYGGYGMGYGGAHPMDSSLVKTQLDDAQSVLTTQFGVQEKMLDHQKTAQLNMLEAEKNRMLSIMTTQYEQQFTQQKLAIEQTWKQQHSQLEMALFYAAAGFWKLNTSFLDGPSSCAAVFGVQTAARAALMLGGSNDQAVQDWEAVLAPLAQTYTPRVVIALELSIALGLLLKPNVGVRVGVLFHAINAWAPPAPNNIASFSLVCLVRLVTFAPKAAADALHFTMAEQLG